MRGAKLRPAKKRMFPAYVRCVQNEPLCIYAHGAEMKFSCDVRSQENSFLFGILI